MDTAASSTLPWNFLSSIPCLIDGRDVQGASGARNLIQDFKAISNDATLLKAFVPTQPSDADGGFFSYVRDIGAVAGKKYYAWTQPWPAALPLELRSQVPMPASSDPRDLYLSPAGLIVPWPLCGDADGALNDRLTDVLDAHNPTGQKYPEPIGFVGMPPGGLWLHAFMMAVDYAISPDWPTTKREFKAYAQRNDGTFDNAKAKAWVEATAVGQKPPLAPGASPYPASLTVHVDTSRYTAQTEWQVQTGTGGPTLHLVMGWNEQPKAVADDGEELLVDRWPCGSFLGE